MTDVKYVFVSKANVPAAVIFTNGVPEVHDNPAIEVSADDDAEIVMLPQVFLNATDQNRGEWASNVIDYQADGKSPVRFETARSHIGTIAHLVGKRQNTLAGNFIDRMLAACKRPRDG